MLRSRCRTAFVFFITLIVTLSYLPMPVSSLPIMAFQNRESYTSSLSYNDDKLVFDVSFALVLLVTLSATCAWIACRMTIVLFITWVNRLLAVSIASVEQLTDLISYLRLDTIVRIVTSIFVDANDAGRDFLG